MKENEVQWPAYWWFPLKSAEELAKLPKDQRDRYEAGQKQAAQDFQSLHSPAIPDAKVWTPPSILSSSAVLVSPKEYDFNDAEVDVHFHVGESGAEDGLKIGVQTTDKKQGFEHIPYLLEFDPGVVRISGPLNLFDYTGKKDAPRWGVKAEKLRSALPKGDYKLTLHRDEMLLRFELTGPLKLGIAIEDAGLTNWIFTTTQLVVRMPSPPAIQVTACEIRRRAVSTENRGLIYFREGKHDDAEKELFDLAGSEDLLKQAQANFRLGMIKEIYEPPDKDLQFYKTALERLNFLRYENDRKHKELSANLTRADHDQKAAIERDLKNLAQSEQDRIALAIELHVRRIVRLSLSRSNWSLVENELLELNQMLPPPGKIGEPLAWEFQSVLEYILNGDRSRDDKISIARSIFRRLGVEPGSKSFGKSAYTLANLIASQYLDKDLSKEHIAGDLEALHKNFPAEELIKSFKIAIEDAISIGRVSDAGILLKYIGPSAHNEEQLKLLASAAAQALMASKNLDEAEQVLAWKCPLLTAAIADQIRERQSSLVTADFATFTSVILPALANAGFEGEDARRLGEALDSVAQEMISPKHGRLNDLVKVHEAMRGQKAIDGRLARSFADAIQQAAQGSKTHNLAEDLLRYASTHISGDNLALQQASTILAQKKVEADANHDNTAVLPVYKIYPAPGIIDFVEGEMQKMLEAQKPEDAIKFYIRARPELGREGSRLTSKVASALEKLDVDKRDEWMRDVWQQVHDTLQQQKNDAGDRAWIMEFGDLRASFGQLEEARFAYHGLYTKTEIEPELFCKATVRLAAVMFVQNDRQWFNIPRRLLEANRPDEARLAGSLLVQLDQPADDLLLRVQALGGPQLFEPTEWEFMRGIRLLLDKHESEAQAAWQNVINDSAKTHSWISGVASALVRRNQQPDKQEQKKLPEKREKSDKPEKPEGDSN